MKKRKILNRITKLVIFIIFTVLLFISIFIYKNSKNITFEQLLYSVIFSKGTSVSAIWPGFIYVVIRTLIILLITYIIKVLLNRLRKYFPITIKIGKKIFKIYI